MQSSAINVDIHETYGRALSRWMKMDDCYNRDVKRYAQRYIAAPAGQMDVTLLDATQIEQMKKSTNGLIQPLAEGAGWDDFPLTKKYINDGYVPDLLGPTTRGNMSLVGEHKSVYEAPDSMEYLSERATKDGKSLNELFLRVALQILLKGRCPLVLDIDDSDGKIKIVQFRETALLNWEASDASTDDSTFNWAIFRDYELNEKYDPISNRGVPKHKEIIIRHMLVNGIYTIENHRATDDGTVVETIVPTYMGKTIDFIPVIACGSLDNTPDIDIIPLEGIADCEISIYDLSCMLKHAENTSTVPTMYMTGVDKDETPGATGLGVLISLADSQARVGYTTTDTSAMTHLLARIVDLYSQAQELGASLLGSRKGAAESGEALRLRQASATASLKSVVGNVGVGLQQISRWATIWAGGDENETEFTPNQEFSTFSLTANEQIAMIQSWQSTAISHSTLLESFRKAGMLHPGETVQDELDRLDKDGEKYEAPVEPGDIDSSANDGMITDELDVGEGLVKTNTMDKTIKK